MADCIEGGRDIKADHHGNRSGVHTTEDVIDRQCHYVYYRTVCTLSTFCTLSTYEMSVSHKVSAAVRHSDMQQLYVADVLLWKLVNYTLVQSFRKQQFHGCDCRRNCQTELYTPELNISELVELLQQSAVERLTTFRELEVQYFGSVATIVTTDFEAMYAYKRGDYQRCLQLSTKNVHTMLYAVFLANVLTLPEFIQLLDDDIVSLIALTLVVRPECRGHSYGFSITQLTLSLYLMTQCQIKLRPSVTSLAQTLKYIEVAQKRHSIDLTLNHLTLKLTVRTLLRHLNNE